MSRAAAPSLPVRDGVSPSTVALPAGQWPTVLDFLAERFPFLSRPQWRDRLNDGDVRAANGNAIKADMPYAACQHQHTHLHYWRSVPQEPRIPFDAAIIYQDDYLVVADKPHFLPVAPSGRYVQETLLVRLRRQLGIDTLTPMHRLDRETAGLVAFTIQPHTRDIYQGLFRTQQIHKVYEAVAAWRPDMAWPHTVRNHLTTGTHFMTMQAGQGEVNACTHIDLLDHCQQTHAALYRLTPSTGQRHQLRVHMHGLGLPIQGDSIYPTLQAASDPNALPDYSQPLQLLARGLAFTDPVSGVAHHFTSKRQLAWPIHAEPTR
jgi:tRNA pseudouridine32 synthase / 23S rRNA pseudouridine746 synthase